MKNNEIKEKEFLKDVIIKKKNGLTVSYNKQEFKNNYPNLMKEIEKKANRFKIDSINYEIENPNSNETKKKKQYNSKRINRSGSN
ncbi:MAG: hypothetical protein ACTSQJ_00560 [Promethearchaeota archaeon]